METAKMVSREVVEIAARCPENLDTWRNLVTEGNAAGMDATDLADLLMEFGCHGIAARELVAER